MQLSSLDKFTILALLSIVPYLRAVRGEFLFDDPYMLGSDGPMCGVWSWDMWRGSQRALVHVLDTLVFRVFRVNETGFDSTGTVILQPAWPWHVLSLAMHAATTWAFFFFLMLWVPFEVTLFGHPFVFGPAQALVAAAIFAVHPLQVSAVCYLSGRAGIQAALFSVLGLVHASLGGWHWGMAALCQYFAFKSKPDGLIYLAFYPLILWKT